MNTTISLHYLFKRIIILYFFRVPSIKLEWNVIPKITVRQSEIGIAGLRNTGNFQQKNSLLSYVM